MLGLSTLAEPEDSDVLRRIFLMCLSEYQLLDEQLTTSAKKLVKEIEEQGIFNSSLLDRCVEENTKVITPNTRAKRLMYLALHHSLAWRALLNAETDSTLKERGFYKTICCKAAILSITGSFKYCLLQVLAQCLILDLLKKISPSTNPTEVSEYLTAVGAKTAEDLLCVMLDTALPECSLALSEAIMQNGFELPLIEEAGIHLHAQRLLSAFEKDVMINRLTLLCRYGIVHALDALQKLFISLSILFQHARVLTVDEKIKHQLAVLIVFALFYKELNAETLFGSRAKFYQQDFESIVLVRSACSYQKEGSPKNSGLYTRLFEPVIQRIAPGITKEHTKPCMQAIDTLRNPGYPVSSVCS